MNRLRQVTSAIRQQGANRSPSSRAAPSGPPPSSSPTLRRCARLVGKAIQEIAQAKDLLDSVFEILETERMLESGADDPSAKRQPFRQADGCRQRHLAGFA